MLISPDTWFCLEALKPLSGLFTELFNLDPWTGEKVFFYLVGASLDNTSIEDFCSTHTGISPDLVLKQAVVEMSVMESRCNRLLGLSARLALKTRRREERRGHLCIDYHDVEYRGERQEHTTCVLMNKRRRRCFRYGVSCLASSKRYIALSISSYKEGTSNAAMVSRLMEHLEDDPYSLVLMDKFFYGIDVMDIVEEKRKEYLLPCRNNPALERKYLECQQAGVLETDYVMRRRTGGTKEVRLRFKEDPVDRYHAYVSNSTYGLDEYRRRNNIETLFKMKNQVHARTSSPNPAYRLLLETISLILTNLWKQLVEKKQVRIKQYKEKLLDALFQTRHSRSQQDTYETHIT